jgi:hypothetical protein
VSGERETGKLGSDWPELQRNKAVFLEGFCSDKCGILEGWPWNVSDIVLGLCLRAGSTVQEARVTKPCEHICIFTFFTCTSALCCKGLLHI